VHVTGIFHNHAVFGDIVVIVDALQRGILLLCHKLDENMYTVVETIILLLIYHEGKSCNSEFYEL